MKIRNPMHKGFFTVLIREKGQEEAEKIMERAVEIYDELLTKNADECKALKAHSVKKIYPVMSIYRAMTEITGDREAALEFADKTCSELAEKQAEMIRKSLKIPGLYKKMPAIFKWMTVNNFGEAAGFRAEFYDTPKNICKFDMTHCAYYDVCRKNGFPELTKCFCHTDDVTDGNMHPKIKWLRTKTIGEGADLCDFQILVEE